MRHVWNGAPLASISRRATSPSKNELTNVSPGCVPARAAALSTAGTGRAGVSQRVGARAA
jgi:hypothetical protein